MMINIDLLPLDHHEIKAGRCLFIEKLTFKESYSVLPLKSNKKPSSAKYTEKLFKKNNNLEQSARSLLPQIKQNDARRRSGVFIVNFEQISVFLLLAWNMSLSAGKLLVQ